MDTNALPMELIEHARESLVRLEEILPNAADPAVYDFGKFLAEEGYLRGALTPSGFIFVCEQAFLHLAEGNCGFGRGEIVHALAMQSRDKYRAIRRDFRPAVTAVFPEHFAGEVLRLWQACH